MDLTRILYVGSLVAAPLAFGLVAVSVGLQGNLLQAAGFGGIALVVGGMSVYFWRGGE